MKAFGNALLVLALSLPNARGLAQSAQSAQRSTTVAAVRAVWAVGDGDKIAHDAHAHRLARSNTHWNGRVVTLVGARNEIVAFQLVVEAGTRGIDGLSISLPTLQQVGGNARIVYAPSTADPSLSVGRPIQLFSVRDMLVTGETTALWAWKPGSAAAPVRTVGWQPVQLIPENARAGRGGFPLRVKPNENQLFWIELYIARSLPAGEYRGVITITANGSLRTVPVALRVLGFALPDENSLTTMVYFEPEQTALYHGRRLDSAYHRMAHRHRIELVHAYNERSVRANIGRFDGRDFSGASGYEGPGEGIGNHLVPATFYGAGRAFEERESAWERADAWMSFLAATVPAARTFVYLADEPDSSQYADVMRIAQQLRSNPGRGRALPTLLTGRIEPAFIGLVDIWCMPVQSLDIASAERERAKGRGLCFYNGGRPNAPAIVIDAPATEARAVAWAAFKHGLELYFYWHATHWQHNTQTVGERNQNVWANPVTFDNRGQSSKPLVDQGFLNGDGVLFYPGEEVLHAEEDRGIAGPIGTIQLANLRRGAQDHLYLSMARQLGLHSLVQATLQSIVPRVFSDASESVGFAQSGEEFERARRRLGDAIERATRRNATRPIQPPSR